MTRRGSLVYYLSAWVLGCFFTSLLVWIRNLFPARLHVSISRSASGLLALYFFSLIFGSFGALVGAFLLRMVMTSLKCKTPAHWAFVGAILAPVMIVPLGIWERRIEASQQIPGMPALVLLTYGPRTVLDAGWWLAVPAGAATAYLLCRIHRAFSGQQPLPTNRG